MNNLDSDVVLAALVEQLRENSLVKISLQNIKRHHASNVMVTTFLTKHASSLRVLYISALHKVVMDNIISTLIENQIRLRELTIILGGVGLQRMSSLMSYLSSSGRLLENLEVCSKRRPFDAEDIVTSVAASCPKLTRLITYDCQSCSMETLRRLYEQCPHLQDVSIGSVDKVIETDEKRKSVSIEVKGHNEDWAICLSHALRRRQYKQVSLWLREDYNHRVEKLESMLEPCRIHLHCFTHESSLISLLQDLPHLNSLHLLPTVNIQYTDAALAAISEHANSLMELNLINIHFSDRVLSELIKTCHLLERLIIHDCGWESLDAISKLSNVNMVNLGTNRYVPEEMLDGLLLSEKVKWPSTLEDGLIRAFLGSFVYDFIDISYGWRKHFGD
eukprot:scaffold2642_cov183-Ochromonas_danica.AAC.4